MVCVVVVVVVVWVSAFSSFSLPCSSAGASNEIVAVCSDACCFYPFTELPHQWCVCQSEFLRVLHGTTILWLWYQVLDNGEREKVVRRQNGMRAREGSVGGSGAGICGNRDRVSSQEKVTVKVTVMGGVGRVEMAKRCDSNTS